MLKFSELLRPDQIQLDLRATDKAEVLRELSALAARNHAGAAETLFQALMEREKLQSTGIGNGIALPHTRHPVATAGSEPLLVFGRHPQGLAFNSIDNKPVHFLFVFCAPNLTEHLRILGGLSRVLSDANLRQALLKANRAEEALALLVEAERKLLK